MKKGKCVVLLAMVMASISITACSKQAKAEKEECLSSTKSEPSIPIIACSKEEKVEKEDTFVSTKSDYNMITFYESDSSSYAYTDSGKKTYEIENADQLSELIMDESMGEITLNHSKDNKITAVLEYELGTPTKKELDQLKKYMELEYTITDKTCKLYRIDDVEKKSLVETMNKISGCKKAYIHITVNIPENIEVIDTSLGSGILSVNDLTAQFNVQVVSGTVILHNVTTEKTNTISCTSGTIEINPCILNGDLSVNLTSGTIISIFSDIQKKDAMIDLSAISGSIECILPEKIESLMNMNCNVMTGSVELNTNHNVIDYITKRSDYVKAKIANGSEIVLETSNGTVEVR